MPIYKINNDLVPHHQNKHIYASDSNLNCMQQHQEIQNTKNNDSNGLKTEKFTYHHEVPSDVSLDNNCHLLGLKRNTAYIRSSEGTIVEREIRRQLEKEKEIQSLHCFVGNKTTPGVGNCHEQNNLSHVPANIQIGNSHATKIHDDHVDSTKSQPHPVTVSHANVDIRQRTHKKSNVHPFEDSDNEMESKLMFIQPQNETVIEKEIRLTRQRESSLRRARGYALKVHQNESEVEIPVLGLNVNQNAGKYVVRENVRHGTADSNDAGSKDYNAKRLATNRLKQEILKERQREVDLMRQGKIKTLSEERAALDASIIEELVAKELEERRRLSNQKNGFSADGRPVVYSAEKAKSPDRITPTSTPYDQKDGKYYLSPTPETHKAGIQEKIKYNDTYTSAEARIEEEIKEIKRREEELRQQRLQMGLTTNTTSTQSNQINNVHYKR